MKVERIIWIDSGMQITEGWKPITKLLSDWKYDNMKVETAGLLAYEDDDVIGLALSHSPSTTEYIGLMLIAKKNIITREVLIDDPKAS